jgi:RNA polymerase sigma-70 factor (ECF subfamily)
MHIHTPENQRLVTLLQKIAHHDHDSFKQLYDLTSSHLYGIAIQLLRKRELADEVLQDAYISVWLQAGSYSATLATPMTWLICIVRNKSRDRLRKGKMESETTGPLDQDEASHPRDELIDPADPQDLFAAAMEKYALKHSMYALIPSQRQALALTYYNGLSHVELAEHLQVPLGTAKAWVRRGLAQLRSAMRTHTEIKNRACE